MDDWYKFAIVHPGFPIKGNTHASQIVQPGVPVFYFNGEMVGLVGFGLTPLGNVKLRDSQLQITGMLLGPFRIEHLFVPLLAPLNVAGGNVGMLDTAGP